MVDLIGDARPALAAGIAGALMFLAAGVTPVNAAGGKDAVMQMAQARGPAPGNASPGGTQQGAQQGAQPGGNDVERQIADLKQELKITPQQEPQFSAFADVIRGNAKEIDQVMRQAPSGPSNAVEELRREQQFTEAEATGLRRLVPVLQALYDSLSDPQKKVADQVLGGAQSAPDTAPGGAPGGPPPARGGRG